MDTPWPLLGKTVILFSGSRSIRSYYIFANWARSQLAEFNPADTVILQGESYHGVDRLARIFAKRNGWTLVGWPAKWDELGKKAGMVRNDKMVVNSHHVLAAWDGESRGTKNAIDRAQLLQLPTKTRVFKIQPDWFDRNTKDLVRRKKKGDRAKSPILIRD